MTNARLARDAPDIGIVTRDLMAMLRFYHDALGLPVEREINLPAWPLDRAAPPVGRAVYLAIGAAKLKLLALDEPPAAANPGAPHRAAAGLRYLSFGVRDVRETIAALEAVGGAVLHPVVGFGASQVAFVTDPDGNVVELVQRA